MREIRQLGRRALLVAGLSVLTAPAAFAHRSQSVLTSIEWNSARAKIEVTHRIHADDAEIGLARYANLDRALDFTAVADQARLLVYLEGHFQLRSPAGPIELEAVGVEPMGREVNAYQQASMVDAPAELSINNQILRDVYEQQTNLVNVRMSDRTRTLIFSGRDKTKHARNLV